MRTLKRFFASAILCSLIVYSLLAENCTAQWSATFLANGAVYSLAVKGSNIYAATTTGIWLSTNNGANWSQTAWHTSVYAIAVSGNNLLMGTGGQGIFRSTDNGASWVQVAMSNRAVRCLVASGNNVFAGTIDGYGIWYSWDNGEHWSISGGYPGTVYSLAVSGNNVFAGSQNGGVYRSTNNGLSFTQSGLNYYNQWIYSVAVNGNNVFAGSYLDSGIYRSINNGDTWTRTSLNTRYVSALAMSGNNVFAGITPSGSLVNNWGVYQSTDNGSSWSQANDGFPYPPPVINTFLIANGYIFAGSNQNIWLRPATELIGITNISTEIPSEYSLSQNYPNPFNPSTVVRFSLSVVSNVILKVYDMQGREVETLVNEKLQAGTYQADWNASAYSSGVYFYKLTAGDFSETKRMLLIK